MKDEHFYKDMSNMEEIKLLEMKTVIFEIENTQIQKNSKLYTAE
jgi:hypothetical protein